MSLLENICPSWADGLMKDLSRFYRPDFANQTTTQIAEQQMRLRDELDRFLAANKENRLGSYLSEWWPNSNYLGIDGIIHYLKGLASENSLINILHVSALQSAMTSGLKLIRPTTEQCMTMSGIEINLKLEDVVPPYPYVFFEWPDGFLSYAESKTGLKCPRYAVFVNNAPGYRFIMMTMPSMQVEYARRMMSLVGCLGGNEFKDTGQTVEELIEIATQRAIDNAEVLNPAELDLCWMVNRIMMQTFVAMSAFGMEENPPAEFLALQRRTQGKAPKNKAKIAKLEKDKATMAKLKDTTVLSLSQEIPLFARRSSFDERAPGTSGRVVRPHWRRSYKRRQRFGPGLAQVKVVTIPLVLVNKDGLTEEEIAATTVVYKGKNS